MRIVLATSLYPPDIEKPAVYAKELAKRLSKRHDITMVVYGHLPEKVEGVSIVAVDKRRPLLIRLFAFFFALLKETRGADLVYIQNGASVELPASTISFLLKTPLVLNMGDKIAHARAEKSSILRSIETLAKRRAKEIIAETPPQKPEILPFGPKPLVELEQYEESWKEHVTALENIFTHV